MKTVAQEDLIRSVKMVQVFRLTEIKWEIKKKIEAIKIFSSSKFP